MKNKLFSFLHQSKSNYRKNKDIFYIRYLKYRLLAVVLFLIITPIIFLFILHYSQGSPKYETDYEVKDYKNISWKEKADNQGYSHYQIPNLGFDYKIDIYVPKKFYVFKVTGLGKVVMRIKNLKGTLRVPLGVDVGKVKYTVDGREKLISGIDSLIISQKTTYASVIGLNIVSPFQSSAINVSGGRFNIATIHVPSGGRIVKYGDGDYPAGAKAISDRSVFFHNFTAAVVVYYLEPYHTIVQISLLLTAVGLFLFILYFYSLPIPKLRLKAKHFFLLAGATALSMMILSIIFPNPKPIVLAWDQRNVKYNAPYTIQVSDDEIPNYLAWVLGITKSVDALIVGDTDAIGNNAPHRNRIYYLFKHSVKKIFILDQYKNSYAAHYFTQLDPQKIKIVSEKNIPKELKQIAVFRSYPYQFMWGFVAKIIVLLSFLIFTFSVAAIILSVFEVKKSYEVIFLFCFELIFFFMLMAVYIIVGATQHMPLGYHAGNTMGVILTNYFIPGFISGGNLVRTAFGIFGAGIVVLLTLHGFNKIDARFFLLPVLIFLIMLIVPATEYGAKRFVLTTTSAEADLWDYKLASSFDLFALFREVRISPKNAYIYLKNTFMFNPNEQFTLGISQKTESMYMDAINTFKLLILRSDNPEVTAKAHYELGIVYQLFARFIPNLSQEEKMFGVLLSAQNYFNYIKLMPDGSLAKPTLFNLISLYTENNRYKESNEVIRNFLYLYQNDENYAPVVKFLSAENSHRANDQETAINRFLQFIKIYPKHPMVFSALMYLGEDYYRALKPTEAIGTYEKVIALYPEPNNLTSIFSNLIKQYETLNIYLQKYYAMPVPEDQIIKSKIYDNELSRDLNWVRKYLVRAAAFEDAEKYIEAASVYREIIQREKGNRFGFYAQSRLGDVYYLLGAGVDKQRKSMANMYEYLRMRPYLSFSNSAYDENDQLTQNAFYARAAVEYETLLGDYPNLVNFEHIKIRIGDSLFRSKQYKRAIPILEPLLNSSTQTIMINAKLDLSRIYTSYKMYDKALIGYNESIKNMELSTDKANIYDEIIYIYKEREDKLAIEKITNEKRIALGLTPFILSTSTAKPAKFEDLFTYVTLSRGMLSYFLGIFVLFLVPFLPIVVRSLVLSAISLWLSRGLIRVVEQDPIRALISVWPGIQLGISLNVLLISIGLFIMFILNLQRILTRMGVQIYPTQRRFAKF